VNLAIDGEPVRLSRVILCTAKTAHPFGEAAGLRTFASPGAIGGWTVEKSAIYANAPDVCLWAAGRTSKPLDPDYIPIIVREPSRGGADMDMYVSRRLVESGEYGVQFISNSAQKASAEDFKASEESAASGPDLTALISAYQSCPPATDRRPIYAANDWPIVSHAFFVERDIWSQIPAAVEWVSKIPADVEALDVPEDIYKAIVAGSSFAEYRREMISLYYGGGLPQYNPVRRFSSDWIHPAYVRAGFLEIDLQRRGLFGARRGTPDVVRNAGLLNGRGITTDRFEASVENGKLRINETGQFVYVAKMAAFLTTRTDAMLFGGDTFNIPVAGGVRYDYCH
jgi:hypothetical protein